MATRTITGIAHTGGPMCNGDRRLYQTTGDTGAVSVSNGVVTATMTITQIKTLEEDCNLLVKFESASNSTLAVMGPFPVNTTHHTETMTLTECDASLPTASALVAVYLVVDSPHDDTEAGHIHNAVGSTIQIDITCIGRCTVPSYAELSTTQSAGDSVVLSWGAGEGATDNTFDHYEVARQTSTDGGSTWTGWESIVQTTNRYAVVQPPATVGHMYRYYVRTVGSAGESYASYWCMSSNTLLRYEITRCGTPSNVTLSASESSGSVYMSWSAGSSGVANTVSHYEVQRSLSTDGGSTWGDWESVGTTTNLYMWVESPETVGYMYRFYIRTVGSAGESYASYWVQCGTTLKKVKAALVTYTDPEILPNITNVKAAHITELQTNINLVRAAANFTSYEFTTIQASYTGLGGWNAHIEELRTAIDGMGISHEAWLALGDNCPRADVLTQLRSVVEAVAND